MKITKIKNGKKCRRIAHDIALRIDDAPVLSDYIRTFVTEREEEAFFPQQDPANHDYMKESES